MTRDLLFAVLLLASAHCNAMHCRASGMKLVHINKQVVCMPQHKNRHKYRTGV